MFSFGSFETPAITSIAHCGDCVGTQASALSGRMCTVQFIGYMVACAANGNSYLASTFLLNAAMVASASPSLRTVFPGLAAFSRNCLRSVSDDSLACGPG